MVGATDISKLATYERRVFLNLYVVLDLYSRYVVAWMVAAHENSALAQQLFRESIERYEIDPGTLVSPIRVPEHLEQSVAWMRATSSA